MEGQSACGGQQGVLHFKPTSARRGQGDLSAWRPRGGQLLLPVGTVPNLNFVFQRSSSPTDRRSLAQIYS